MGNPRTRSHPDRRHHLPLGPIFDTFEPAQVDRRHRQRAVGLEGAHRLDRRPRLAPQLGGGVANLVFTMVRPIRRPGNLPAGATSFIGRRRELADPAIGIPGLVVRFVVEVGLALWLLVKGVTVDDAEADQQLEQRRVDTQVDGARA